MHQVIPNSVDSLDEVPAISSVDTETLRLHGIDVVTFPHLEAFYYYPILNESVDEIRLGVSKLIPSRCGRIFTGDQGGEIPVITYNRVWRKARAATFVPEVLASPLGGTPYSLRHACVSTWLNGGVPVTQVAEWAGHSVEVLLSVYAKCLHGQDHLARRRIEQALRGGE